MARPKLPASRLRRERVIALLTTRELRQVRDAASREYLTVSEWARRAVVQAAIANQEAKP